MAEVRRAVSGGRSVRCRTFNPETVAMRGVANHFARWFVGLAGPETQTTVAERDCLCRYAAGCRRVVEIGVWHGVTTCRLRGQMAADRILYAVDPYPVGRLGVSLPGVHRPLGSQT